MVFNSLTFDGINSLNYGIFVTGEAVFNAPERVVEMISVPGRNGAIAVDEGRFEKILVTYPAGCFASNMADYADKVSQFRNILASRYTYKRLTDTYHPDEFRLAVYEGGLEVETVEKLNAGQFELTFNCKPQRWLTSGETAAEFTADGTITNPSYLTALPLIRAYGTGKFSINDTEVQITAADVYTDIDCDIMECFKGNANKNGMVRLSEFPVLLPGENTITLDGVTSIEITPRWFVL
jgi:phage-related protein